MSRSLSPLLAASLVLSSAAAREEGQPIPPLRLPTIDGSRTIDIDALRGKKVLLIEFASW